MEIFMIKFTNQEILNSTLLSSMAYIEDRDIRGGELYLQQLMPRTQIQGFLKMNNITQESITSIDDFDKYVNDYLEEIRNFPLFKRVMGQKARFYQRFKDDFEIQCNLKDYVSLEI